MPYENLRKWLLWVFVLVIAFAFLLSFFVPQLQDAFARIAAQLKFPTVENPSQEDVIKTGSTYSSQVSLYIDMSDTPIDKLGKFFRYFDSGYLNYSPQTNVIYFREFIFDFQDSQYTMDDLVNTINSSFMSWSDAQQSIKIGSITCNQFAGNDREQYYSDDSCIPYSFVNDLRSCYNGGKVLTVLDRSLNYNHLSQLKVRVFWYQETGSDNIIHVYPIVSICEVR